MTNGLDPLIITERDFDPEEDLMYRFACDDCGALESTPYRDEYKNRLCYLCWREALDSILP